MKFKRSRQESILGSETSIEFITSFKGSVQICANGFPFTRHRVLGPTVYWRCVQNKSLGCPARLRTRLSNNEQYTTQENFHDASQKVEVVCSRHNHDIITERRKRGSLKMLRQRQKQKVEIDSNKEETA